MPNHNEHPPSLQLLLALLLRQEQTTIASEHTANLLSEARKYRLGLALANQALGQLEDGIRSALGNAGSRVFFRPGPEDYAHIEPYLSPPFTRREILGLPNFTGIARLLVDNQPAAPCLFETLPAGEGPFREQK